MRALAGLILLGLAACGQPQITAAQPKPPPSPPGAVNPPAAVTLYRCADGQTVEAGYPDPQTAVLKLPDHSYTLGRVRSADGARYVGYGVQWWAKGATEGRLSRLKPGEQVGSDPGVLCTARPVEPPTPGQPGGLPDDRTPISEAPFTAESAQGAANVVQAYFALLETGKAAEAGRLRTDGRPPDLSLYAEHHAQVGGPGRIEGAAGSLFVEVPVVIYGRMKTGVELHRSGKAVLRRSNDVPGATPDQRRWRIDRLELKP